MSPSCYNQPVWVPSWAAKLLFVHNVHTQCTPAIRTPHTSHQHCVSLKMHVVLDICPMYLQQELNPFHKSDGQRVRRGGRIMPSVQEVAMYKDFRNVAFLEKFLSPAGRLLPR